MKRGKRWLNVGALTISLVMVLVSSLWAQGHPKIVDYSKLERYNNLGAQVFWLMKKGKYQEAVKPAEEVLKLAEKIFEKDHDQIETCMNNLAIIYMELGRYAEAEPLFKRVLDIDEKLLGPNHLEVAMILNNLGILYTAQGRYEEAEPLHERALAIREEVFGPDSQPAAQSLGNLARLYNKMGRSEQAEQHYMRALEIYETTLGLSHHRTIWTLNNLAELYKMQGEYAKALPIYQRLVASRESALGSEHIGVANSLIDLAELNEKQGQYNKASPLYKRALAIREKSLGSKNPHVALALNYLAANYTSLGQYEQAESLYQRAFEILERTAHPEVATVLRGKANLYQKTGRAREAKDLLARAKRSGMMNKDGVRFKAMMSSSIENERPVDSRASFSVQDDDRMYVYVYWSELEGDHRVVVKWIMPDQRLFNENIYDSTFGTADWRTWFRQRMFRIMPTGVWAFQLFLDGKLLTTKKFSVTADRGVKTSKDSASLEPQAVSISESSGKSSESSSKELFPAVGEKEGTRFKFVMTSGLDKHDDPIDLLRTFSASNDGRVYIYAYWLDMVGDHRVSVKWIRPDQTLFDEQTWNLTFKTATWRTWDQINTNKYWPAGDWTVEVYIDGRHLATKKVTIEP